MGFFDKFRREKRSTEGAVTLEQLLGGNETLTVKIAMQVPAVAYCVEMIASAAAMLPVKLYVRKSGGDTEEVTDDPRITLLNSTTGDTMNADNMRRVWVRDYLLTGSAFAYIETRYGMPSALKYIPSNAVSVISKDIDHINKHYTYVVTGREIFPHRMLKILRNSDGFGRGRGIVGESPLIMDTMYQLLKFQKNQVLKGGNKRGFLKSDAPVRKEVKDDIEEKWRQLNSNDDNAEKIMFLNGNIDFKEMSSTAVEMQLNENVQTNDAEIMRLFGTVDGILSPETVKNAVMPVLDAFEAAFDSDLLLESEKKDHYFAFDTKELTRGSVSEKYSAYATALQNNFMQLDEVRALEDLPPLGFNYITLGLQNVLVNPKTGEVYTPNTNASANMNRLGDIGKGNTTDKEDRSYFFKFFKKIGDDKKGLTDEGNSDKIENRMAVFGDGHRIIDNVGSASGSVSFDEIPQSLTDYAVKVRNDTTLTEKQKDHLFHRQALQISDMLKGTNVKDMGKFTAVSDHAARRICERKITPKTAKSVLENYNISYPSIKHKNARMLRYNNTMLSYSNNGVMVTAVRIDE